jgi:hypothetical protein
VEWGKRCRETPKQLFMGLKSAYHTDNLSLASEFATKLIRFKDEMLNNALAAALITDLGDPVTGNPFPPTLWFTNKAENWLKHVLEKKRNLMTKIYLVY